MGNQMIKLITNIMGIGSCFNKLNYNQRKKGSVAFLTWPSPTQNFSIRELSSTQENFRVFFMLIYGEVFQNFYVFLTHIFTGIHAQMIYLIRLIVWNWEQTKELKNAEIRDHLKMRSFQFKCQITTTKPFLFQVSCKRLSKLHCERESMKVK